MCREIAYYRPIRNLSDIDKHINTNITISSDNNTNEIVVGVVFIQWSTPANNWRVRETKYVYSTSRAFRCAAVPVFITARVLANVRSALKAIKRSTTSVWFESKNVPATADCAFYTKGLVKRAKRPTDVLAAQLRAKNTTRPISLLLKHYSDSAKLQDNG